MHRLMSGMSAWDSHVPEGGSCHVQTSFSDDNFGKSYCISSLFQSTGDLALGCDVKPNPEGWHACLCDGVLEL